MNRLLSIAFVAAIGLYVAACSLLKPAANAAIDIAFAECLARAQTETQVIACTAGRDLSKEAIALLVSAKRDGISSASHGYRDAYDAGMRGVEAGQ